MIEDGSPRTGRRGIFSLGRTLIDEAKTLVRQEIDLAKQETMSKILRDVKAAAMLIVAGVVLLLALFVFIFMLIVDLFSYLTGHLWLGLIITWLIYTIIFGIVALIGVRRMQSPKPVLTIQTLREDLAWLKEQLRRMRP
ncbi:MAG: phage holin family protein [Chloroflexota bacterium]